ncbi:uncharacterized protein RCC_08734 [Ramularia collo-cygni]|uniref:Uncharacterized protein n=1 Tax=Ramularia collo-cygni TaxID=112498 RepID=A0A2D3VKS4_9PEZI|nr:uncharacterized protein RCC_08734 [Ramularia collo-cygni]CZT23024.1 uncharacterized protein RCC_08734 [Ramularia collo-cygni]
MSLTFVTPDSLGQIQPPQLELSPNTHSVYFSSQTSSQRSKIGSKHKLLPLREGHSYYITIETLDSSSTSSDGDGDEMFPPPVTNEPDASVLCAQIPLLARINVAQAYKENRTIAPAAEMTLSGLQESESEAYAALLDVYAIQYQRVVDNLEEWIAQIRRRAPVKYDIENLVQLCGFLGAYQASRDRKSEVAMEKADRVEDVGDGVLEAAMAVAEKKVEEYYVVCASQRLWEIESADRVVFGEDIVRVEKVEEGVRLVMKGGEECVVCEGEVDAVEYARLVDAAEKMALNKEAVNDGSEQTEGQDDGSGSAYPVVNPATASESMFD